LRYNYTRVILTKLFYPGIIPLQVPISEPARAQRLRQRRDIMQLSNQVTAFAGSERIAAGDPLQVALAAKELIDAGDLRSILLFDNVTGKQGELDLRGTPEEIAMRLTVASPPPPVGVKRSPGRPKLGVVGREVTLLPRHWEWLNAQPGGASVALRKLVEQARRENEPQDRVRMSREAAFRFMTALAGDEPGFEEASRALFAGDADRFDELVRAWPIDVGDFTRTLSVGSFAEEE
jgi:uncharacterized protein